MSLEWKTQKLGEVCELLKRGIAPKYTDSGGVCVINQKCIRDHSINLEFSRRHNIDIKSVNPERYIHAGDVLVNSTGTGTLGRVAQVRFEPDETTTVDTHVTIVRPIPELFYSDFFGYMLIKIEDEITSSGEGASGQTELARTTLESKFDVSFPVSIEEQQRIVSILDEAFKSIDQAIANTEKNLANARELFESYLNNAFTQKGEGWVEKQLGEVCSFQGGSQPPKSTFLYEPSDDSVRLIQIRDYKSDKHVVYIPKAKARRFCSTDDVMIGRYGPPLFQILRGIEGAYNVALMKADANTDFISKDYLYYFLKNNSILRYIIYSSSRAAGQIGLNKATIEPYPILFPVKKEEQVRIVNRLEDIIDNVERLESTYNHKLASLTELKQSILQKAFSGELTAEDIKQQVNG